MPTGRPRTAGPSPQRSGGRGCAPMGSRRRGGGAGRAASPLGLSLRPAAAPGNPFRCGWSQGSGPKRLPGDSPLPGGDVVPPPPHVRLSHPLPRDLRGGGEVAREAGQQTEEAWERELGSWGGQGRKGSFSTRRKGWWGEEDSAGKG